INIFYPIIYGNYPPSIFYSYSPYLRPINQIMILMAMERLATHAAQVYLNQDANTLVRQTLERGQGKLNDTGALCIQTGKFTGRSPKDRFIVQDEVSENTVDWGDVNIPVSSEIFDNLLRKMNVFLKDREVWVRHCYAGADFDYRFNVTVIN